MTIMSSPPPTHRFELNCFLTQKGFEVSQARFKELQLDPAQDYDYGKFRELLYHTDCIWYMHGKSIYLLGDEREIRAKLADENFKAKSARSVPYSEMLTERESVLRFLLYSALGRLMRERGFMPSISVRRHSYYPYFKADKNDITVSHSLSRPGFKVIAKNGVVIDLDLSPDGPALLWIDIKLFTFVHFREDSLGPGDLVYLQCENAPQCTLECPDLLEGAFVIEDESRDTLTLPCVSSSTSAIVTVKTKSRRRVVQIPNECAYTTVSTFTLKELGIYDWWRPRAILPTQERHKITWQLINLIAQRSDVLLVPLPGDQELAFDLQPITQSVQMRIA
jgi:hypothetical protein